MKSLVMQTGDSTWPRLAGAVLCLALPLIGVAAEPRANGVAEIVEELEPLVAGDDFHAVDSQLAELTTILLAENPRLRSARALWRSRLQRVEQERSLPDLGFSYRRFVDAPETRVGPQVQAIEVSQGFPWAGKRGQRAQRARHGASEVAWRLRDLERVLVRELKRNYFEAAYLQEALVVNSEETVLLRRFEETALTRYSTGEGIQQSVIKVQTDISRLVDQGIALQERLDAVVRRIAELIGRPESPLWLQPIPLILQDLAYDGEVLEEESVRHHPRTRSVEQAIQADQAWLRGRQLASRPDLRLGVSWIDVDKREDRAGVINPPEDNGQDIWAVNIGVTLPIYGKRNRAGVGEARESARSNRQRLETTRDGLRFVVQEAILHLEAIHHRARLYRDVIVPQAEESLASAEAAYTTNRQGFLDLLDAERVLIQVRLTHHRLLADYWAAIADLEYGLGGRFPEGGSEG